MQEDLFAVAVQNQSGRQLRIAQYPGEHQAGRQARTPAVYEDTVKQAVFKRRQQNIGFEEL